MLHTERPIDLVTVGRAGIDFNTTVLNCAFEEVTCFEKSIGGSPANIVQGAARLGLKSGFIGKISGDGMGEYILHSFDKQGIDCSGLCIDRTGARNCLAVTEILSAESSGTYSAQAGEEFHHGTYLYREKTADMLITPEEVSEELLSKTKAVLLSGTAFSASPSREAMFKVLEYAQKHQVMIALDVDYRPFGWKDLNDASQCYQAVCGVAHLIIGNREEFNVVEYTTMPDNRDNARSAKALLAAGVGTVIVKDGARGSAAYQTGADPIRCGVIPTKAVKTFGSGDAYAAGLMYGLLRTKGLRYAVQLGTACASLVLTQISCAPAMPDWETAETHRLAHIQEMEQ